MVRKLYSGSAYFGAAIFVINVTNGSKIELELCWNNKLYQDKNVDIKTSGKWFFSKSLSISSEKNCNKDHAAVINGNSGDFVISKFKVIEITRKRNIDGSIESNTKSYLITKFEGGLSGSISLTNSNPKYIIEYPDNYLTACDDSSGCIAKIVNSQDYKNYKINMKECSSSSESDSDSIKIGVILRGKKGNLDRFILDRNEMNDVVIGNGDIGNLLDILLDHEYGENICIESVTVIDPFIDNLGGFTVFSSDYLGNGIFLSSNCGDEEFTHLSDTAYIPCYDTPFPLKTYEKGNYTSIEIKTCAGDDAGISSINSKYLSMTITGLTISDEMQSYGPYSLYSSSDNWTSSTSRDYTFASIEPLKSISAVSISNNNPNDDKLCIDNVLINKKNAFLINYWVGGDLPVIPAVLDWPICKIELITSFKSETPLISDPESVATASCINKNRLSSVKCSIDQTFETYEEISWSQEIGTTLSREVTFEKGTETTVSTSTSGELSVGFFGIGARLSHEVENSLSLSSSLSISSGSSSIETITDGKVNGKTKSISCSGSIEVPPSQEIRYSMFIGNSKSKIETITDIKMTKCSSYLYGSTTIKKDDDPSSYIYIYGVNGELIQKESTHCYVSFEQATQVNPNPNDINCGKERALTARQFSTFVPICNDIDSSIYSKCQCDHSHSDIKPTCGCVDQYTGNLQENKIASVVHTGSWQKWCNHQCGTNFTVPTQAEIVSNIDPNINDHHNGYNNNNNNIYYLLLFAIFIFLTIYAINSINSLCNKSTINTIKYQKVNQYDTEV